tara:strand:+ start:760 stop:3567 length:2808 start_codon:yes stop_codon:yes gene_type:complete
MSNKIILSSKNANLNWSEYNVGSSGLNLLDLSTSTETKLYSMKINNDEKNLEIINHQNSNENSLKIGNKDNSNVVLKSSTDIFDIIANNQSKISCHNNRTGVVTNVSLPYGTPFDIKGNTNTNTNNWFYTKAPLDTYDDTNYIKKIQVDITGGNTYAENPDGNIFNYVEYDSSGTAISGVIYNDIVLNETDIIKFVDSGGTTAGYSNNEYKQIYFNAPNNHNILIKINKIDIESYWDFLSILVYNQQADEYIPLTENHSPDLYSFLEEDIYTDFYDSNGDPLYVHGRVFPNQENLKEKIQLDTWLEIKSQKIIFVFTSDESITRPGWDIDISTSYNRDHDSGFSTISDQISNYTTGITSLNTNGNGIEFSISIENNDISSFTFTEEVGKQYYINNQFLFSIAGVNCVYKLSEPDLKYVKMFLDDSIILSSPKASFIKNIDLLANAYFYNISLIDEYELPTIDKYKNTELVSLVLTHNSTHNNAFNNFPYGTNTHSDIKNIQQGDGLQYLSCRKGNINEILGGGDNSPTLEGDGLQLTLQIRNGIIENILVTDPGQNYRLGEVLRINIVDNDWAKFFEFAIVDGNIDAVRSSVIIKNVDILDQTTGGGMLTEISLVNQGVGYTNNDQPTVLKVLEWTKESDGWYYRVKSSTPDIQFDVDFNNELDEISIEGWIVDSNMNQIKYDKSNNNDSKLKIGMTIIPSSIETYIKYNTTIIGLGISGTEGTITLSQDALKIIPSTTPLTFQIKNVSTNNNVIISNQLIIEDKSKGPGDGPDLRVGGDAIIEGDSIILGDQIIEGDFYIKGDLINQGDQIARFKKDVDVSGTISTLGTFRISDKRLKENIKDLNNHKKKFDKLRPVSYNFIQSIDSQKKNQVGFLAQEVEELFPETIITNNCTGMKNVDYTYFISMLVKEVQDLKKQVKHLKTNVKNLELKLI